MPQRRVYDEPMVHMTFRASRHLVGLIDWLASREGMGRGHYMRAVIEDHLRSEGFDVTPGKLGVLDPVWGTSDGWKRERTKPATTRRSRT